MLIIHSKNLTQIDGTDTNVVMPSDWNNTHNVMQVIGANAVGDTIVGGNSGILGGIVGVVLYGGNNITLSAASSDTGIFFNGPNKYQFAASNGVTFGTSNNTDGLGVDTVTASIQAGMYYSGANGSASSGTIKFANSNGVSWSTGTQGLYASIANGFSASGGSSSFNNIMTFSNSANGVTFSNSNGQLVMSHSLQQLSNTSVFQQTSATSAITSNAMNNSVSTNIFYTSAATSKAGIGTTFAGTNATATMVLNSNGLALSLNAGANSIGTLNQTGPNFADQNGVTVTSGTVVFANSNGISFGIAAGGGGGTITASTAGSAMGKWEPFFPCTLR